MLTSWAGWPVEPMLAISHGSWLMAALGEQVPGGVKVEGLAVETGDGGGGRRWAVVGGRGPARLCSARSAMAATPVTVPRTKRERGPCPASRVRPCCSSPFNPLQSPSHHQQCPSGCRSVGHAQGKASRWLAAGQRHRTEAGQSEIATGRRLRFSRPTHHEKGTKGRPRRPCPAPTHAHRVLSRSQSRSGRSRRRADLERGEGRWTYTLRKGGEGPYLAVPAAQGGDDWAGRGSSGGHGGVGRLPCGPRR